MAHKRTGYGVHHGIATRVLCVCARKRIRARIIGAGGQKDKAPTDLGTLCALLESLQLLVLLAGIFPAACKDLFVRLCGRKELGESVCGMCGLYFLEGLLSGLR